jgi:UDP:flavonoid glycosyltransferase YjiC (YdhE family)
MKNYEKVILISQGTIDNKDQNKLIIPAIEGLKNENYLLLVATGGINTALLRSKYESPKIIIEDYLDFDYVMNFTDLYITNGGYGGVMQSLGKGVPVLGAGIKEGKNDINAHIRYFKLGIDLKTEQPSPSNIKSATKEILGNSIINKNVQDMKNVLSAYQANELIEKYIFKLEEA